MSNRVGVLGSICNPPHLGHATLARCAAEQLGLERVLLIPTGSPAHRDEPGVSPQVRLQLAEAAAHDEPVLEASAIEVERPGPSYMADTLELLLQQRPATEFVLLLGADQHATLDSWHEPDRIRRAARIAVAPRTDRWARFAGSGATDCRARSLPRVNKRWLQTLRLIPSVHESRSGPIHC